MSITSITQIAPTPAPVKFDLDVNLEMRDLKIEVDLFDRIDMKRKFLETWITYYQTMLNRAISNGHRKVEDRYMKCIEGARKLLNETIKDSNKAGGK